MGFNNQDANALNIAAESYFSPVVVDVKNDSQSVYRFEVGPVITIQSPAEKLADALMGAARFFNHGDTTTVWVAIETTTIPTFVTEAIERCAGFGLGLVVTHGTTYCSHPPGLLLPAQLRQAIGRAQRTGSIWHPVLGTTVDAGG